jgi:hypothetical protein
MKNPEPNPAIQPRPCPRCSRETEDARLQRYADGLKRLAEYGLVVAEALAGEARGQAAAAEAPAVKTEAQETPPPVETATSGKARLAQAFDKVARAVRLSFMLEERFHADFAARRQAQAQAASQAAAHEAQARRRRNRATIERVVTEAIGDAASDKKERDALGWQLKYRLDRPDMLEDLPTLPVGTLIARICRDLGLDPDGERWQNEAWYHGADEDPSEAAPICPICGCRTGEGGRPPKRPDDAEPEEPPVVEARHFATGTDPP